MSRVALPVMRPGVILTLLLAAILVAGQCNCVFGGKGNSYTMVEANAAVADALSLGTAQVGTQRYPHNFGNLEKLALPPNCAGNMKEFPVLRLPHPRPSPQVYSANTTTFPGPDRVVYHRGTNAFCGCITHTSAKGNSFVKCN
ncbi:hypothetical protein AB1N83_007740 [Pleurotus pulmonarius]